MNRYLTKEDTQMANKHMKRCCTSYTIESESEVTQSCPTLCDPMDLANQVLLSMGFPRQEYWSELPFPFPGDLPNPGIKPMSPTLAGGFFTTEPPGKIGIY